MDREDFVSYVVRRLRSNGLRIPLDGMQEETIKGMLGRHYDSAVRKASTGEIDSVYALRFSEGVLLGFDVDKRLEELATRESMMG
ncbi:MAG: hypothetical protein WC494_03550 [Candidatus Pacearchaeota archaeon]